MAEPKRHEFEQYLNVRSAYTPTFSPQGDRLAFISDITGVPQVWALSRPGGWPELLSFSAERVTTLAASPTREQFLFGMDAGGSEREQLYLLEIRDDESFNARKLTDAPEAIHSFGGFSPDGKKIAFTANRRHPASFDVYLFDLELEAELCVFEGDGMVHVAGFSPDGGHLLVVRVQASFHQELFVLDLSSGTLERLTPEVEARFLGARWAPDGESVYVLTDLGREFLAPARLKLSSKEIELLDETSWDAGTLALSRDGRLLAYSFNVEGYSQLYVLDLCTREKLCLEGLPPGVIGAPADLRPVEFSPDGNKLALSFTGPRYNSDIWVYDLNRGRWKRWTRSSLAGLSQDELVEPELVRYPSFDRLEIPAWLYRPRGASSPRGFPVVVLVHGGPESQARPIFNPVIQYFVHRGYAVFVPNVRGSTGYGKTYMHLDDREKRMDAVADLKYGAEWLIQQGLADPKRIAVMGGSYGGFMVLAALTAAPDLWAAGVDIVGIANFVTFLERTGPWRRKLREAEYGSLERDRELLERISPIHSVERIRAPLLIIHGANDPRVPVSEAEQIVERLKALGRTVEYLRFDDEGHGIVKLKNKLIAYPVIAEFLDRHLMS
jgi:dipeptidyl aminopeptidase/acylaminoacyl peptidase